MRINRRTAIEIMQYLEKEADMVVADRRCNANDRQNFDAMTDEELVRCLNGMCSIERQLVVEIEG